MVDNMENIGYYNGTFAPQEELMIPACDRGVYLATAFMRLCG